MLLHRFSVVIVTFSMVDYIIFLSRYLTVLSGVGKISERQLWYGAEPGSFHRVA